MISKFAFKAIVGAITIGAFGLTSGSWFIAAMATLGWVIGEVITNTFEKGNKMPARKRILVSKVTGVTYEGRQDVIATLRGNEPCRLRPEPTNPYDANAIAVEVSVNKEVKQVGYLPRDLAKQVAPYLDGETILCRLRGKTGGFETRDGGIAAYGLQIEIELPDTNASADPDEGYIL